MQTIGKALTDLLADTQEGHDLAHYAAHAAALLRRSRESQ